jgi:hypothetical protein
MELEKIFQLHEVLLEKYLPIEGLPHWPINVNKRESQIILKDMSARVIEELGEGYESTTYVLEMLDKIGFNFNRWEREEYRQLLNHLQNSNEEQADAIAFFVNLLFYSNITVEDVKGYLVAKGLNKMVDSTIPKEDMSTDFVMMVGLGILQNRFEDSKENQHTWDIFNPGLFEQFDIKDYDKVASYTPAFHKISWGSHDIEAKMCWELSYHLSVARNYLKNKPWKQTGEMTDEQRYQEEVVIAFLELLGYFRYIGFTAESLLQLRYKKHLVCEFRIKSKY